jgi:hypothetical protein
MITLFSYPGLLGVADNNGYGLKVFAFANIHFYEIDTPLKQFVASRQNVVRHCTAIHEAVARN